MKISPSIQRILVPHDFSATAEYALEYALGLAKNLGAKVTVVHSYEAPRSAYPDAFFPQFDEFVTELERAASSALAGVVARTGDSGVAVHGMVRRGVAWNEIVTVAAEMHADLIVMGTHGRRGVARALLGSVAEKVVRVAPCAVLTVHLPASEPTSVAPDASVADSR